MGAYTFSVQQIQSALQNLLPQGRVWPRDPDSVQADFWQSIAGSFKRVCDAAGFLLVDAFPSTTEFLLPEWEETLGLPDPCVVGPQTIAQRVAAVVAKFTDSGGQSAAYFIALSAALGYPGVTVINHAPFRTGHSRCGDPVGSEDWIFVWTLNAPTVPVSYFRCGTAHCGDPLYSLGGPELRCTTERYAPAHTKVLFSDHA